MQTQSLVTIIPWTFIAQICNLFLQVYLIKRFLFKPINEMLEKRRALADAQIREAEEAKQKAREIEASYEQNMAEAKEQANAILMTAQKNATAQSEELIKNAEHQAAQIRAKAEADIEQEKRKAVNDLKNEIGGLAVDIAGKVIEREISENDHKKLIDDFIANVGEAS